MYAIVKVGGKQYRVSPGDQLKVEKMPGEIGQAVVLDQVLTVSKDGGEIVIGKPLVAGASVKATVKEHGKSDKVRIFKMRRRKHYQKHQGHRQLFTALTIDSIQA